MKKEVSDTRVLGFAWSFVDVRLKGFQIPSSHLHTKRERILKISIETQTKSKELSIKSERERKEKIEKLDFDFHSIHYWKTRIL